MKKLGILMNSFVFARNVRDVFKIFSGVTFIIDFIGMGIAQTIARQRGCLWQKHLGMMQINKTFYIKKTYTN